MIIFYGIVLVAACLLSYIEEYPSCKLRNKLYLDFKLMALKKISRIDYESYQELGTGMLIQRIENGAEAGTEMLFGFFFRLVRSLGPSVLFSLIFIGRISTPIMSCIVGGYAIVFIITYYLLKYLYHIKERILINEEKLNSLLVRGFMELCVFRLNRRFQVELEKSSLASKEIVKGKVKMNLLHEAFFASFALLIIAIKVMIIYYGWQTHTLTIGAIIALITLVDNAYTPIAIFNVLFVQYKLNQSAFKRYETFLEMKEDIGLKSGMVLEQFNGKLEVCDVAFKYKEKSILSGLNLQFNLGERIALVGESGSGKSTLVKLLIGLLKPVSGTVLVDDKPLNEVNLESYYEQIAYISQEAPVFDGTIRENLVFDQSISEEKLMQGIEKVELAPFISKLEKGLDTPIGEKGITLSGGERQRLALARLFFSSARIIILDEATSAMDNVTEEKVMQNMMAYFKGKTMIMIAHRLSSIKNVDRIIVFKEGQVVGDGTYETLLRDNPYFQTLAQKEENNG